MTKRFNSPEDIIADESFQAWFTKSSQTAIAAWENWLVANPDQRPLIETAVEMMTNLRIREKEVSPQQIANAYQQLSERLDAESVPVVQLSRSRSKWWLSAAAAVLLIIAGAAFWKFSPQKSSINSQYGQLCTRQLPDGSTVTLNANSTAKLGDHWETTSDREVWLKGEAFFHVKKTAQKNRFIVHTNELDIIVTGTQFNVWTRDNKTSVLLTEGSVTIKTSDGRETNMVPGDFVEINNSGLEKKKVNEESVLAWKDNKIVFEDTPLSEVCRVINEHYGVKVTVADTALNSIKIGGMMNNNNLEMLLKTLEASNSNLKITRKEDEIIISKP